ncbi:MAG TPA: hypothetical protein VLC28_04025 [Flavitalea sp.]|nr:hypothetical protein [Flavitalea sp.]
MLKNPGFVAAFVSIYLLVYTVLFQAGAEFNILMTMFILSPFMVAWMVYVVLKFGKFNGNELNAGEEWGYSDRSRESLGVF